MAGRKVQGTGDTAQRTKETVQKTGKGSAENSRDYLGNRGGSSGNRRDWPLPGNRRLRRGSSGNCRDFPGNRKDSSGNWVKAQGTAENALGNIKAVQLKDQGTMKVAQGGCSLLRYPGDCLWVFGEAAWRPGRFLR